MRNMIQFKSWGRAGALGLLLGALSACDSLLEVEIPHVLTEAALEGPETAATQVNSAIAQFECGSSAFGYVAMGHEDVLGSVAGVGGSNAIYRDTPDDGGDCDINPSDGSWFNQIMGARRFLSNNVERGDLVGTGVYDRIQNDDSWSGIAAGEASRLSAISAIYMAAIMSHFGEFYCEMGFDGGDFLGPADALTLGEGWATTALGHIGADFALPNGISTSAIAMATALRARIRWAQGNLAEAAADAATIATGYSSWITRETGQQRRNKIFNAAQEVSFGAMYGVIDWWQPATRDPNPATGQIWAQPIPFTGYIFLGVMPDGRTVDAAGYPVRWADEQRDANDDPVSLGNGAVQDTRVLHTIKNVQGPGRFEVPAKYSAADDDIPLVAWTEMRYIQAENANALGDRAGAIAFVNEVRAGLTPTILPVTYIGAGATADEVRYLIIEERRRDVLCRGSAFTGRRRSRTRTFSGSPGGREVARYRASLVWAVGSASCSPRTSTRTTSSGQPGAGRTCGPPVAT